MHISQTMKMAQSKKSMKDYLKKKSKKRRSCRYCKWLRTFNHTQTFQMTSDFQGYIKMVDSLLMIQKYWEGIDKHLKTLQNKLGVLYFQESSI